MSAYRVLLNFIGSLPTPVVDEDTNNVPPVIIGHDNSDISNNSDLEGSSEKSVTPPPLYNLPPEP